MADPLQPTFQGGEGAELNTQSNLNVIVMKCLTGNQPSKTNIP